MALRSFPESSLVTQLFSRLRGAKPFNLELIFSGWKSAFPFDFPLRFPHFQGLYHMVKCPVSKKSLEYLPVSDAVWKVLLTGWDTGRQVACVDFEEQVVASYKRKH